MVHYRHLLVRIVYLLIKKVSISNPAQPLFLLINETIFEILFSDFCLKMSTSSPTSSTHIYYFSFKVLHVTQTSPTIKDSAHDWKHFPHQYKTIQGLMAVLHGNWTIHSSSKCPVTGHRSRIKQTRHETFSVNDNHKFLQR